ncbi:MAG: hypothetical protein E6K08_05485 [Methanobacteriota archaeon]|nr:MAG: hypothetical protein E6K08_05485 [Euryarchaeota archaeon]
MGRESLEAGDAVRDPGPHADPYGHDGLGHHGEKGFRDLLKEAFFHGAKGVVAVCDLTRYSTLKELDDWVQGVFNVVGEVPVVYAVNKIDLKDEVMILYGDREIEQAARAFEAPYFYASAKTGENVETLFRRLGTMVLQREGIPVAT